MDRSSRATDQLTRTGADLIDPGLLTVCNIAIEDLALAASEARYDLAIALRVGVLDGRHPRLREQALARISRAVVPDGKLLIGGGTPLVELPLLR